MGFNPPLVPLKTPKFVLTHEKIVKISQKYIATPSGFHTNRLLSKLIIYIMLYIYIYIYIYIRVGQLGCISRMCVSACHPFKVDCIQSLIPPTLFLPVAYFGPFYFYPFGKK